MPPLFTADHHFGHTNILKYANRPFENVDDMNESMISKWNEVVGSDDTVYYVGDFTLAGFEPFVQYVMRLNGKIKFIPGGHDHRWLKDFDQFVVPSKSGHFAEILPPLYSLEIPNKGKYPLVIVLCHYPLLTWDRSHYGAFHLHGHSHGKIGKIGKSGMEELDPPLKRGERMDIGVDCHDYYPVSLEKVLLTLGKEG